MSNGRNIGIWLFLVAAAAVMFFVFASRWKQSAAADKFISKGLIALSVDRILSDLQLDSTKVLAIGNQNLRGLQDTLLSHPLVESVEASMFDLNALAINFRERTPELAVLHSDGLMTYFDRTMHPLPYSEYRKYYQVPLVSDVLQKNQSLDSVRFHSIIHLLDLVRSRESLLPLYDELSELAIVSDGSYSAIMFGGMNVLFSGGEDLEGSLMKLAAIYNDISHIQPTDVIDLRWKNMVVIGKTTSESL